MGRVWVGRALVISKHSESMAQIIFASTPTALLNANGW
jgi:hypothetical protein